MDRTVDFYMTPNPITVNADALLATARELSSVHGITHLPVFEDGRLVGVLTEEELQASEPANGYREAEGFVREGLVRDWMEEPLVVAPYRPVDEVLREMVHRGTSVALVVAGGRLVGIFTVSDAVMEVPHESVRAPSCDRWGRVREP